MGGTQTIFGRGQLLMKGGEATSPRWGRFPPYLHAYWSGGQGLVQYIDKTHTALDIFRFAAFFLSLSSTVFSEGVLI